MNLYVEFLIQSLRAFMFLLILNYGVNDGYHVN